MLACSGWRFHPFHGPLGETRRISPIATTPRQRPPSCWAVRVMATVHPEPQAGLAEAPCGLPQARRSKVNFVSVARKAALAEAPGQVSLAKAVLAAKADKNQAATRAPSAAPVTAPKMVDCNRTFGLHKMVSKSSLIRRRQRRHAAPPPVPGIGAAKLERDVGDTVASVAISEDDMCAPLFLCVPCDHAPEVHICNVDCSRIPHMLTITVLAHVSSWRPSPPAAGSLRPARSPRR